jgi:hypothetical protein
MYHWIVSRRALVALTTVLLSAIVAGTVACSDAHPASAGASEPVNLERHPFAAVANGGATSDDAASNAISGDASSSAAEDAHIQAWLDSVYPSANIRHSFLTKFGELVSCLDFSAQASVKALAAQGLPSTPPNPPPSPPPLGGASNNPAADVSFNGALDEDGNARSCPTGTVPVMPPTMSQIQAAGGLDAFLSARASVPPPSSGEHDCFGNTSGPDYDHAVGYENGTFSGLLSALSIYSPYIYYSTDHEVSQLWIQTGNCEYDIVQGGTTCIGSGGTPVQSLEAGYIAGYSPYQVNGDLNDHLFVFWAANGYSPNNCPLSGDSGTVFCSCWAGSGLPCDQQPTGFVVNQGITVSVLTT